VPSALSSKVSTVSSLEHGDMASRLPTRGVPPCVSSERQYSGGVWPLPTGRLLVAGHDLILNGAFEDPSSKKT